MSKKICSIDGCGKCSLAHGFCSKHLYRYEKYGNPYFTTVSKDGHKKQNLQMYRVWLGIKTRCYNKKNKSFKNYGGKGVVVCDRWLGKNGFINFLNDMGNKPGDGYSIDRIDHNGPYSPENCRWATWEQQENNRSINVYYEYLGERLTIPQWSRKLGIKRETLYSRARKGLTPPELFNKK